MVPRPVDYLLPDDGYILSLVNKAHGIRVGTDPVTVPPDPQAISVRRRLDLLPSIDIGAITQSVQSSGYFEDDKRRFSTFMDRAVGPDITPLPHRTLLTALMSLFKDFFARMGPPKRLESFGRPRVGTRSEDVGEQALIRGFDTA